MTDFEKCKFTDDDASAFDWLGWRHLESELSDLSTVLETVAEKLVGFKTFEPIVTALNNELQQFVSDISAVMDECEDDMDAVLQCVHELSQEQSYLFEALDNFLSTSGEVLDKLEETLSSTVFQDLSGLINNSEDEIEKAVRHFANVLAGAVTPLESLRDSNFERLMPREGQTGRDVLLDVCQKVGDLNEKDAQNVVFHMMDWQVDMERWNRFLENPQGLVYQEIHEILVNFLIHAPNHMAAAAKLYVDYPVRDIFGVGAVQA